MPTSYVGNQANTQAPSAKPEPEADITLSLPNDGEALNVSSLWQDLKALADFINFAVKPKAKASTAIRFLRRFKTAVGHTRFALDRVGMPAATCMHWQEMWSGFNTITGVTATTLLTGTVVREWAAIINSATGLVRTLLDTVKTGLQIRAGDGIGEYAVLYWQGVPSLTADLDLAVEASNFVQDNTDVQHVFGIEIDGGGWPADGLINGLFFVLDAAAANWKCVSVGAVGTTNVALGGNASLGSFNNFRIEFRGANVVDGGTASAYFYVDGTLVGTITTNLPPAGVIIRRLVLGARNMTGNSPAAQLLKNWFVNFACNWIPSVTS